MNLTTVGIIIISLGFLVGGIFVGVGIAWIIEARKVNRD